MSYRDLIVPKSTLVLPWFGDTWVADGKRQWRVGRQRPPHAGWWPFNVDGSRVAEFGGGDERTADDAREWLNVTDTGYLVGDRFVRESPRLTDADVVWFVERGVARFARVGVGRVGDRFVYLERALDFGPEPEVDVAFQDRLANVDHIAHVTPALDIAFRFASIERLRAEERRAELERERAAQERMRHANALMGTAVGRRELAVTDFDAAARAALRVGGAELVDTRTGVARDEVVVTYRFRDRRLQCVVDRASMRVIDAGICLTDHDGTKGDTWFTLESLVGVVDEAINTHQLVIFRHG